MRKRVVSLLVVSLALSAVGAPVQAVQPIQPVQAAVTYWQDGACAEIDLGGNAKLTWCVETVVVAASGRLDLMVSWKASSLAGGTIDKGSDTGNKKMYLVDNLGNRYDHIETRGAAADGGRLSVDNPILRGIFVFPAPRLGATAFTFRDDDQNLTINGITSSDRARSDRALTASVLGRVMQTEAIEIDYSWTGPSGRFQEGYSLRATEGGFEASGVRDATKPITLPSSRIPSPDIEAFLATLAEAPVLDREYVPNLTHADDHTLITLTLLMSRDRIVFFSQSQGVGHIPWGVESGGKVYVVPDDTPARALQMLDPFFGRDLASRATTFLVPHIGRERAREVWAELEEKLGTEDAYKTAFRLKDLLGHERDDEVWAALDRRIEEKTAPPEPVLSSLTPDGDSTLVRAARDGDVATIELMLGQGSDVNERSELDGHTALIAASRANHGDSVRVLLAAGADASVRSRTGETALTMAAAANGVDSVKALLESALDVNIKGRDGKTPLMQAAENGHAELVTSLLEAEASVDIKNLRGSTALGFAAANRHLAIVRGLLNAGANPNLEDSYGETPLMRTMHPRIARALIRAGANVNAADDQGLTPAMRLSAGDGPRNPDGGGPRRGGGANRLATLQALLAAGADVNARDLQGRTALIWATTGSTGTDSHPELLPVLIHAGANVDTRDSKGATALVYAAIHGHLESARILIDAGADVNVRMGRTTALGFALEHGHGELVTLLLRSGGRR